MPQYGRRGCWKLVRKTAAREGKALLVPVWQRLKLDASRARWPQDGRESAIGD